MDLAARTARIHLRKCFWEALCILGIFLISISVYLKAPVSLVYDSNFTILVSESLIKEQSFFLDSCNTPHDNRHTYRAEDGRLPYQLREVNGHIVYFYPNGSSVLSVPYVALMNVIGISAENPDGCTAREGKLLSKRV